MGLLQPSDLRFVVDLNHLSGSHICQVCESFIILVFKKKNQYAVDGAINGTLT